ncbi:MAG: prepilin-type N-terminal cleavage/methylation domain-containing protein [Verrucomicrobiota bacterium JB024]|nr:prepilin-type N-terminal cleavage/methylation domain-containing protein [Verrucomicrobiota bacterium JB024]
MRFVRGAGSFFGGSRCSVESSQQGLKKRGFSLMEVLICLSIIAVLSAITFTVVHKTRAYATMSNEVSAARRLTAGYLLASQDNGGKFMPGLDQTAPPILFRDRLVKFMEAPHRYPFRLAPYLNYELEGAIFVNGNREQIVDMYGSQGDIYDYMVSLWPAMGMNMTFVGGKIARTGNWTNPIMESETLFRLSQMHEPVVLFVSAGMDEPVGMNSDGDIRGYHEVTAPFTWSGMSWSEGKSPTGYGNVAFRHDGKAVCAFLDGSIKTLTSEELRDMRLWSPQAARLNAPFYVPSAD